MKTAGLIAIAALGVAMVSYSSTDDSTQLFLSQRLGEDEASFLNWINLHGKNYPTKDEYKFRFQQFKKHLNDIANHDEVATGIKVGLNAYSDNTEEEWQLMKGLKLPEGLQEQIDREVAAYQEPLGQENLGSGGKDWRNEGKVTPMKDQSRCGSCWAFGAVGAMESNYAIQFGELRVMSEQQSVDCVVRSGNSTCCFGCRGGFMEPVYIWFQSRQRGIVNEAYVAGHNPVPRRNAAAHRAALDKHPITVAIEAENHWFRGYRGGIITRGCGQRLDHAVVAVGYGTDASAGNYFIIKNSWGTSWGEGGYVRIAEHQCGVTHLSHEVTMAQSPVPM